MAAGVSPGNYSQKIGEKAKVKATAPMSSAELAP
jgi:hypothetical protein